MTSNIINLPRNYEVAECGNCDSDIFFIAQYNIILCAMCHTIMDGVEWHKLGDSADE